MKNFLWKSAASIVILTSVFAADDWKLQRAQKNYDAASKKVQDLLEKNIEGKELEDAFKDLDNTQSALLDRKQAEIRQSQKGPPEGDEEYARKMHNDPYSEHVKNMWFPD